MHSLKRVFFLLLYATRLYLTKQRHRLRVCVCARISLMNEIGELIASFFFLFNLIFQIKYYYNNNNKIRARF